MKSVEEQRERHVDSHLFVMWVWMLWALLVWAVCGSGVEREGRAVWGRFGGWGWEGERRYGGAGE